MITRKIKIVNNDSKSTQITQNEIIIDLAHHYIKQQKENRDTYNQINHVQLYKKILLSAELVRARERK